MTEHSSYSPSIVLIGAGNVATHLGRAFHEAGCRIKMIYSRTQELSLIHI